MKLSKGASDLDGDHCLECDASGIEHRFSNYMRVWPVSMRSTRTYPVFAVGRARPWAEGDAGLYELTKEGREYNLLANFSALAARGLDTTGQPLLYGNEVFIPMWSSKFYTDAFLGLAIVSCNIERAEPDIRYFDRQCTYGNHFFPNLNRPDDLFLGVGKGGGGRRGRIRYTPDSGILLKSSDRGKTWRPVFTSDKASAIYDGVAIDDLVIITSRELGAILVLKEQTSGAYGVRKTYWLGSPARNISLLTWRNSNTLLVSSNDGFYEGRLNGEDLELKRIGMPITGFVLRYPTIIDNKLLAFIGRSSTKSWLLLCGTENELYYVDLTSISGLRSFSRMTLYKSIDGEQLLLGTEMEGRLRIYDTKWLLRLYHKVGMRARFETAAGYLYTSARRRARDVLSAAFTCALNSQASVTNRVEIKIVHESP